MNKRQAGGGCGRLRRTCPRGGKRLPCAAAARLPPPGRVAPAPRGGKSLPRGAAARLPGAAPGRFRRPAHAAILRRVPAPSRRACVPFPAASLPTMTDPAQPADRAALQPEAGGAAPASVPASALASELPADAPASAEPAPGPAPGPAPIPAAGGPGAFLRTLLWLWALALGLGAVAILPGHVFTAEMEHDVLHLIDGARRIALGQVPHLDFSTPLGALSLAPIAWAQAAAGSGWAMALLWTDMGVALLIAPLLAWGAATRLGARPAIWLGVYAVFLAQAQTWRVNEEGLSLAMSYNRWAWALLLALAPLLIAPMARRADGTTRGGRAVDAVDAAVIGLGGAALFWMKITFAGGLFLPWAAWALLGGRRRAAMGSALVGAAAVLAGGMIVAGGPVAGISLLGAYFSDLAAVAGSTIRPAPGASPVHVLSAPNHAPLTLGAILAALLLLKAGERAAGVAICAALAGTTLIAWQNFANDQLGFFAIAAVVAAAIPRIAAAAPELKAAGAPAPLLLRIFVIAAFFAGMQQVLYLNRSISAGWRVTEAQADAPYAAAGAPEMLIPAETKGVSGRVALAPRRSSEALAAAAASGPRRAQIASLMGPRELMGRSFPDCSLLSGDSLMLGKLQAAFAARPDLQGRTVLMADVVNSAWMLLGAPPQRGVQIWHYQPHAGEIAAADLLIVPNCPISTLSRNMILDEAIERVAAGTLALTPVISTPEWEVYETEAR